MYHYFDCLYEMVGIIGEMLIDLVETRKWAISCLVSGIAALILYLCS